MFSICGECGGMLVNQFALGYWCSSCMKKRGKRKPLLDIKSYIGDGNYYWYTCIETLLGDDLYTYIEGISPDGVVFTKNKYHGGLKSRQRWIKKYCMKSIYKTMDMGVLEMIGLGIPLDYNNAYMMLSKYLGGETRPLKNVGEKHESNIEYIDESKLFKLKQMCSKYILVRNGDMEYNDENEPLILYILENTIDNTILDKIVSIKRIEVGRYPELFSIMENLP